MTEKVEESNDYIVKLLKSLFVLLSVGVGTVRTIPSRVTFASEGHTRRRGERGTGSGKEGREVLISLVT